VQILGVGDLAGAGVLSDEETANAKAALKLSATTTHP